MILYLQTISKRTEVMILDNQGSVLREKSWKQENNQSELVLKTIHELLEDDIPTHIIVMKGMGSFTGTRIGVAIANALAFAWSIPMAGIQTEEYVGGDENFDSTNDLQKFFQNPQWEKMVEPVYNREPRIG